VFTSKGQQCFPLMCKHGMEHEGLWRPFPFGFAFILQAKGANGVTMNAGGPLFQGMLLS
jgi:hypothetical protein